MQDLLNVVYRAISAGFCASSGLPGAKALAWTDFGVASLYLGALFGVWRHSALRVLLGRSATGTTRTAL